jgi:hypothetical protein
MTSTTHLVSIADSNTDRAGVRMARAERHLAVGSVALIAAVTLTDHIGSPAGFFVLVVAVGATVRSFARAVDASFGQFYGWVYGEPKAATRIDRVAFRVIHRHRYGKAEGRGSDRFGSRLPRRPTVPSDSPAVQVVELNDVELAALRQERSDC